MTLRCYRPRCNGELTPGDGDTLLSCADCGETISESGIRNLRGKYNDTVTALANHLLDEYGGV